MRGGNVPQNSKDENSRGARRARRARVDSGRGRGFERFEVQMQPRIGRQAVELRPLLQLRDRFAGRERADQVLFVPAGEDDQLARSVVHAGADHRRIPLPAVGADERRIGFEGVLVHIIVNIVANYFLGQKNGGKFSPPAAFPFLPIFSSFDFYK